MGYLYCPSKAQGTLWKRGKKEWRVRGSGDGQQKDWHNHGTHKPSITRLSIQDLHEIGPVNISPWTRERNPWCPTPSKGLLAVNGYWQLKDRVSFSSVLQPLIYWVFFKWLPPMLPPITPIRLSESPTERRNESGGGGLVGKMSTGKGVRVGNGGRNVYSSLHIHVRMHVCVCMYE